MKDPNIDKLKKEYSKKRIVFEGQMFFSPAYLSLTKTSMLVLQFFLISRDWETNKKGKFVRYYNNNLVFTYAMAKSLGISASQFGRATDELYKKGFIDIEHQGGQFGNKRDYSRYNLIEDWKQYGTLAWRPREKPKGVYNGGFDKHNQDRRKSNSTVMDDHGNTFVGGHERPQ